MLRRPVGMANGDAPNGFLCPHCGHDRCAPTARGVVNSRKRQGVQPVQSLLDDEWVYLWAEILDQRERRA